MSTISGWFLVRLFISAVVVSTSLADEQISFGPADARPPEWYEADSSNYIFASFAGLLEQWPNTFARSGHSIVPGVIPKATLLYHGTNAGHPPTEGVEWLAFDPEMSYKIHAGLSGQVDLHTYLTSRPLRVIYLDGQSASLFGEGALDSQSVLINGTVEEHPDPTDPSHVLPGDYSRAHQLCKIGKSYGFEGVVRMNTGFELLWCDFKEGLKFAQVTNATDPFSTAQDSKEESRGKYDIPVYANSPFYSRAEWGFVQAATRHYFTPGEVRVKLDPSGFVSFYDRVESLALKRRADGTDKGSRSRHRLYGISSSDVRTVLDRLRSVLDRQNAHGWQFDPDQVDWRALVLTIVRTYSHPLHNLEYVLKQDELDPVTQASEVLGLTYGMLMPYVDFSRWNTTNPAVEHPAIRKCSTTYTAAIAEEVSDLTESEHVIIRAIEGTLHRLCSTVYDIFSESITLDLPFPPVANTDLDGVIAPKIAKWRHKTQTLIDWLGWSTWRYCDPACKPNEVCLAPMWPSMRLRPSDLLNVLRGDIFNFTDVFPVCHNRTYWKPSKFRRPMVELFQLENLIIP